MAGQLIARPRGPIVLIGGDPLPPTPQPCHVFGPDPGPPLPLLMPGRAVERHGPPDPQTVGASRDPVVARGLDAPPFPGSVSQSRQATPFRDIPPRPTVSRGYDSPPFAGWAFVDIPPFRPTPQPVPDPVVARQMPFPTIEGTAVSIAGLKMYTPVPRAFVARGEDARPDGGSVIVFRPRLKQEVRPAPALVFQGPGPRPFEGLSFYLRGRVNPVPIPDPTPVFHSLPRLRFRSPKRPK